MKLLPFILGLALITSCSRNPEARIFIGTYTGKGSEGVYTCSFSPETGAMGKPTLAVKTDNPSFLVLTQSGEYLYAVNETGEFQGQPTGAVSAFKVDAETGSLALLNQVPSLGGAPCHLSLDKTEKFLFVANYTGGNIAVLSIDDDHKLSVVSSVQFAGSGPHERQEGPHAHSIQTTPGNDYVLATDLGTDKIMIYRFDQVTGMLRRNDPPFAELQPGAGPRHLVVTPAGNKIYVLNELNSTVISFDFDAGSGTMMKKEIVSTLPPDFSGTNTAAEIVISPDGRFLYTSNRGHDSIAQFEVDEKSGRLAVVGWTACGKGPRHIRLDPGGKWMLVSNQYSDLVQLFNIEPSSGKPSIADSVALSSPVCTQFTLIP